jgi:hypothetical protein
MGRAGAGGFAGFVAAGAKAGGTGGAAVVGD